MITMRHFMFIKAAYKVADVKVDEEKILAVYNLAKKAAENSALVQLTFAGIDWSVKHYGDSMRVSLITQEIMYSIYDGKDYKEPVIEVAIFNK